MNIKQEVLAWVNQVRAERGIGEPLTELPKGVPGQARCCVIAKAIGHCEVGPSSMPRCGYIIYDSDDALDYLPDDVNKFALDFDVGRYPELVAGS